MSRAASDQTRASGRDLLGQLSAPLRRFVATEASGAVVLLAATAVALVWANSGWAGSYESVWTARLTVAVGPHEAAMTLGEMVDDGLLAAFFFVIGLEVRRELSIGELTDRRRVLLPALAGVGGTVLPALVYLALSPDGPASHAWGLVIGTDTAFLLGALALVGPRVSTQLRIFLLSVAVVDDIIAVAVVGLVYSGDIRPLLLVVATACALGLVALGRAGGWRSSPYVVLALAMWLPPL